MRGEKLTGRERPHPSGKPVDCGHTVVPGGVPRVADGAVMLDTACYRGSFLTAVELESGSIIQASQSGKFRGGISLGEL